MNRSTDLSRTAAELLAVGEIFKHYGGERAALEVARRGGTLADLHRLIGANMRSAPDLDRAAGVTFEQREIDKFSLSRLILNRCAATRAHASPMPNPFDRNRDDERSLLQGERASSCFELEMLGSVPLSARRGGVPLPFAVLQRDFNIGTADQAGNLSASGGKPLEFTPDAPRNARPLQQLGAVMAGGFGSDFTVPTIPTDQTNTAFVTEVAAATEGQPVTGAVTFAAKRVTAYVEPSMQALVANPAMMDRVLSRVLMGQVMAQIENAAINGDGTGANPTGIRSTTGITNVVGGTNGAQIAWSHILDLENGPALVNASESDRSGYLLNTKTRRWLKNTQRASGLPFIWDGADRPVNGHRAAVSNFVPSNLVKGGSGAVCSSLVYSCDWSMLLIPIFGVPDLTVDPFSKSETGQVRVIVNVYMAAGALMPAAFAKMDDGLTA